MATLYQECYETFLDYNPNTDLLYPRDGETEEDFQDRLEETCFSFLKKALPKFTKASTRIIRNDIEKKFEETLRPYEIDVIALLMLVEQYRIELKFLTALKPSFSDKDWKTSGKDREMNQLREVIKETKLEAEKIAKENSFINADGSYIDWLE